MTIARFICELEEAAGNIAVEQRYVLAALLRRAAFLLRNSDGVAIEAETDRGLKNLAAKFGEPKPELIRRILREWLEQNSLPVPGGGEGKRTIDRKRFP
jgi:hypothetical protein